MYELKYFASSGEFATLLNSFISLEIGRQKNDIGTTSIVLNLNTYDETIFEEDGLLEIYRNGQLLDSCLWFLRQIHIDETQNTIELVFFDHLTLLSRRYNAWFSLKDSITITQYPSQFEFYLDDICKFSVFHNYREGAVDATLNTLAPVTITSIPQPTAILAYDPNNRINSKILIESYHSKAPVSVIDLGRKSLLEICKNCASVAEGLSTNLWFDFTYVPNEISYTNIGYLLFRTWVGIRGNDNNNIRVGKSFGNLINAKLTKDYTDVSTLIYALGKDVPPEAVTYNDQISEFAEKKTYKLFYPIEKIVEFSDVESNLLLQANAVTELSKATANLKLTGDIVQTDNFRFIDDYKYGDVIYVEYRGFEFPVEINKYLINIERNIETVSLNFETSIANRI